MAASQIMVITNIEHDHPDIYPTINEVRSAFVKFADALPEKGMLVACGDCPEVQKLLKEFKGNVTTYGFNSDNDYVLERPRISGGHMFFTVTSKGTVLSDFMLKVIGEHNALNALAAIIVSLEVGMNFAKIKKGLLGFTGSKRRLELIGNLSTGARVYDDYAHHPTEIRKTLQALRSEFPKKKIVVIFQPHTYSRTKKLFDEFITSFSKADTVLLTEIFPSLRESPDPSTSSKLLCEALKTQQKNVFYLPGLSDVVKYLNESRYRSDTVIITMGAGDIYKIHNDLKYL